MRRGQRRRGQRRRGQRGGVSGGGASEEGGQKCRFLLGCRLLAVTSGRMDAEGDGWSPGRSSVLGGGG